MNPHAQHMDTLEALVLSDDPLAELERSAVADCPECRAELRELLDTERLISASGAQERAAIRASEEHAPTAGAEQVEAFLRPRLEAGRDAPTAARPRLLAWLIPLAAAAVVVVFFGLRSQEAGSERRDPGLELLGPGSVMLEIPARDAASFETFRWRGDLPRDGWFILRVTDPAAPRAAPLFEGRVQTHEWRPRAADLEAWPRRIAWEVQVFNSSNALEGSSPRRESQRSP